jgi:hypothetical protein
VAAMESRGREAGGGCLSAFMAWWMLSTHAAFTYVWLFSMKSPIAIVPQFRGRFDDSIPPHGTLSSPRPSPPTALLGMSADGRPTTTPPR